MLPAYHRLYDAKLILIAVPACAMLWARETRAGRIALGSTGVICLIISDLFRVTFREVLDLYALLHGPFSYSITLVGTIFLVPLLLLFCTFFYLWVYVVERPAARLVESSPSTEPAACGR